MARRACRGFVAQLIIGATLSGAALAQPALETARTLLAAWHDDPARIDRARTLLEAEAAASPSVETLIELSDAWFLTGEFRATSERERMAAYEQGSRAARRAIAIAPLYLAQRRWAEAARELQAVLGDDAPSDVPRWATRDRPRARALLSELRERGRVPGLAPESP